MMSSRRIAVASMLWLSLNLSSYAAETVTIESPDNAIMVTASANAEGRLTYAIERLKGGKTTILRPSPLGITLDGIDLGDGVKLGTTQRETHDERYPWRGGHPEAINHYHGARIAVTHTDSDKEYTLEVRVFGDGMAYRYIVPGAGQRTIGGEASAWNLPDDCQIWYETDIKNYEGLYAKGKPSELEPNKPIGFPVTIVYADGTYGAITEAGVFAYSGMSLRTTGTTTLRGVFEDDKSWQETGEIRTPWRVTMTGPDLNALVNCDIVHNLCPPPDKGLFPNGMNTAWIKPGRALWNWWSDSPVEFQYQTEWVDKAAAMGLDYYLVDAGWERHWQLPDKDKWACLKELCDHARQKGIGIHVWKFWGEVVQPEARRSFFRHCTEAGAVGIKIDFMDLESRERIDFYTETLIDAAKARLMINYHGANKPTGESRTFPNEMTREGIRGLEYNKWSELPATHYATLPFTRYLAGHGDFTPCTFNPERLKGTTATLQLASAIAYTSPLMHWADHWKLYLGSDALEVIKQIPSTWDETRVLPGSDIGQVAALARRKGSAWFVGIINGGQARTYALDLSFLDDRTYRAVTVRDVAGQPAHIKVEHTTATKDRSLAVAMETGGGFVAWLVPESVGANHDSPARTADGKDDLSSFVVVSPRDNRYFELSNGNPYIPIGFNLVGPPREAEFDRLFATMTANRINYLRVWLGHNEWNVEHEACLQFDTVRAETIERFLALARQNGIRVKMCLEYFRDIRAERSRWSDNLLYHRANGGRYESMHEYLFSRAGRDHFKAKLDWYADRYGDEPAVFAWELWNEMDAVRDSEWLDWTKEMLPELKRRWPHNLAIQSLGSYDWQTKRDSYRTLCLLKDNDVAQVHRYLDEGAGWEICHGPVDVLSAQAVRELIAFDADKPIILTETGAVKPRHTGCSELYAKDPEGTLLHDMLFAPFFSGAAGTGHVWWWRQAIETPNLWYHFARFAEAVKGIDPPAENFQPVTIAHDRLRIYALSGRTTVIAWCRDARNDWRSELADGKSPETLGDVEIDVSSLNLPATATVQTYDPWTDTWQKASVPDGTVTIPALRRSIVVRFTRNAPANRDP